MTGSDRAPQNNGILDQDGTETARQVVDESLEQDRRSVLKTVGTAGIAGLAGCTGTRRTKTAEETATQKEKGQTEAEAKTQTSTETGDKLELAQKELANHLDKNIEFVINSYKPSGGAVPEKTEFSDIVENQLGRLETYEDNFQDQGREGQISTVTTEVLRSFTGYEEDKNIVDDPVWQAFNVATVTAGEVLHHMDTIGGDDLTLGEDVALQTSWGQTGGNTFPSIPVRYIDENGNSQVGLAFTQLPEWIKDKEEDKYLDDEEQDPFDFISYEATRGNMQVWEDHTTDGFYDTVAARQITNAMSTPESVLLLDTVAKELVPNEAAYKEISKSIMGSSKGVEDMNAYKDALTRCFRNTEHEYNVVGYNGEDPAPENLEVVANGNKRVQETIKNMFDVN